MSKRTTQPNAPLTIGLDIGYGYTKAITATDTVIFPSVMGYAREIKFRADELAAKYPGDQLADDEGTWFIGELAQSQLRIGEVLRLRGRTANEAEQGNVFRTRLAKAALGKLLPDRRNGDIVHIRIATGLPVDHMRDAGGLKSALIGQHLIQTDQTHFIANIADVMVMPQPYGTVYRNMLTDKGALNPCHTFTRTGVVDVGTYTVDLALDDDGEFIDTLSGSTEAGVFLVEESIASAYERDYRQKPSHKDVQNIIHTGCFRVRGKTINYTDEREAATEPLRAATLGLMGDKWQTGANVDVIYLSGGGAHLVERDVKAAYPQTQMVEQSQLANARGYLNYALFADEGSV